MIVTIIRITGLINGILQNVIVTIIGIIDFAMDILHKYYFSVFDYVMCCICLMLCLC
jgi:hypothetical protein